MKKTIGLLFLMSAAVFARDLTLEEAIELSLNNSKKIEISSRNLKIGNINLGRAFKAALPTVTYEGSYSRNEHSYQNNIYGRETPADYSGKGVTISDISKENEKGGYTSQFVISQPIFQGGAILGGIKGAKAQAEIADLSFVKEKRDVRLSTIQNFSDIVMYQKNLEALETSKKELEIRLKEQESRLALKLIIKADLLKTQVSLLDVESQIVQVKNQIEVAMKQLKIDTGLVNEEDLNLVEFMVPENLSEGINFDNDMVIAKTKSLDALISKNNVKYAQAEKMVAFSENLPKVDAFAQYGGYERESMDDTFHNEEWRAGVKVTWELFNFGSGIDSYRVASQSYKIEELNDSITQDNIEINLTSAYSEVIRLEKYRVAMKNSLEASMENYQIDTERYKAGLISAQDYLNSEAQLRQSKVDYNKAESDYLVAFEKYRSLLI